VTSTIAKMFVATATIVLVTGLAAGAFAGDRDHRHHRPRHHVTTHSTDTDGNTVTSSGQYVGRDPDSRMRQQMLIDFNRGVSATGGR
jgi:hypothetical protein